MEKWKIFLGIVLLFLGEAGCFAQSGIVRPALAASSAGDAPIVKTDSSTIGMVNVPDSIYRKRLAALPFELKLTYNPKVRKYIELYTKTFKNTLGRLLGLSTFYFPIFDEVLRGNELPGELKYITILESALNPTAVSSASAVGLWQFVKGTGKENGLTINSYVDQRKGVYESTGAAAVYLKKLFGIYQDWMLVLAAYNCGPGTVNKAILRAGGLKDFWKIYSFLPKETREYVPRYIGIAYAFNYFREHGIEPVPSFLSVKTDTVTINKGLNLGQVSRALGMDPDLLTLMNPQYLKKYVPGNVGASYTLNVPFDQKSRFLASKDSLYASASRPSSSSGSGTKATTDSGTVIHKVKSGDSLWEIAKRYHVSVNNLREWNDISGSKLSIGQKIVVNLQQK